MPEMRKKEAKVLIYSKFCNFAPDPVKAAAVEYYEVYSHTVPLLQKVEEHH